MMTQEEFAELKESMDPLMQRLQSNSQQYYDPIASQEVTQRLMELGYPSLRCSVRKSVSLKDGIRQILVKWKGYPEKFNQWINENDLVAK